MAAYGWIRKGQQRQLQTSSARQRLNLHGAINVETTDMTVIESTTINKESALQLLQLLEQKYCYARQIVVILDNASYHHCKGDPRTDSEELAAEAGVLTRVRAAIESDRVCVEVLQERVFYNRCYKDLKALRAATIGFFANIGQHADELLSLLDGGFEGVHT
jgi:hypothetical protein